MNRIILAGAAAAAALSVAAPAQATVTMTNYAISGTGTGTFTLSYDSTTSAYSLVTLDFSLAGSTYDTSNSGIAVNGSDLVLGAFAGGGVLTVDGTFNDFWLWFDPTLASQSVSGFNAYYGTGTGLLRAGSYTVTQVTAGVPEPATWALMLLGFGGMGLVVRRRRRTAALA